MRTPRLPYAGAGQDVGSGVLDDTTTTRELQQLDSLVEVAASELLQFAVATAAERRKPAATVFMPSASKQLQQVRMRAREITACQQGARLAQPMLSAPSLTRRWGRFCVRAEDA